MAPVSDCFSETPSSQVPNESGDQAASIDHIIPADRRPSSDIGKKSVSVQALQDARGHHSELHAFPESQVEESVGMQESRASSSYQTSSKLAQEAVSEDGEEAQKPTIVYYKQGCRKRIPKTAQNVEFRRSRSRREAWAAFQAYEAQLARRQDHSIVKYNTMSERIVSAAPTRKEMSTHGRLEYQTRDSDLEERTSFSGNKDAALPNQDIRKAINATIASIRDLKKQIVSDDGCNEISHGPERDARE